MIKVSKIRHTIRSKFIAAFIISIIIGNLLSVFIILPYIHRWAEKGLLTRYEAIISELTNAKTFEELEELIKMYDALGYKLNALKDIDELNLTEYQKLGINDEGKLMYLESKRPRDKVAGKIGNDYFTIELKNYSMITLMIARLTKVILIINMLICSVIISLVTKRMTKPIIKLADATNEISAGNFDVNINIKSNDEIGMLVHKFNSMTRELKNIEYMQTDFINNVSHELKTPLSAIEGFANILKSNELSQEERSEYLDIIIEETGRMSELSSNILTLVKLGNIDEFNDKKNFFLDEQLRRTVILLEKQWTSKNISFNLELSKTSLYGKEEYLMQLWINLINNAIKFSRENSEIDICCYKNSQYAFVKIKDYGCGMNEDTKKRIFDKFYQGDTSRKSEGCGLGLPICKRIIDLSKGKIQIDSEEGRYTEILVSLPCE